MDMMDIYVSPDDIDIDHAPAEEKVNAHRVVWLKCKAKAEKALNLMKQGREKEETTSSSRDNMNALMKAPLVPEQDTRRPPKDHFIKMDNDMLRTQSLDSFGETTVNIHAPTVEQLDLHDRDPTDMNKHVRIWFEEVLAEPEGMHSFDRVWRASFVTFTTVKFWCYRFCTLLCGVPFALCFGVYFACLTFLHVWYVVPCIKSCLIVLHWAGKMWTICVRTFCDPCCESFGKIFSNIQLTNYRQ
ncbi:caveolin-1-like [Asterias amurensis]|uniref:caveolin-1-like n=1 Tax=Asterias amurensis TaxID=7602 RepID=UPI003AB6D534